MTKKRGSSDVPKARVVEAERFQDGLLITMSSGETIFLAAIHLQQIAKRNRALLVTLGSEPDIPDEW